MKRKMKKNGSRNYLWMRIVVGEKYFLVPFEFLFYHMHIQESFIFTFRIGTDFTVKCINLIISLTELFIFFKI